ncbi:MAG: hypothetical protein KDF63_05980, partial [Rhodoferax sp.]|nr:hypothetical protein [Rhodoferax sp.]
LLACVPAAGVPASGVILPAACAVDPADGRASGPPDRDPAAIRVACRGLKRCIDFASLNEADAMMHHPMPTIRPGAGSCR